MGGSGHGGDAEVGLEFFDTALVDADGLGAVAEAGVGEHHEAVGLLPTVVARQNALAHLDQFVPGFGSRQPNGQALGRAQIEG